MKFWRYCNVYSQVSLMWKLLIICWPQLGFWRHSLRYRTFYTAECIGTPRISYREPLVSPYTGFVFVSLILPDIALISASSRPTSFCWYSNFQRRWMCCRFHSLSKRRCKYAYKYGLFLVVHFHLHGVQPSIQYQDRTHYEEKRKLFIFNFVSCIIWNLTFHFWIPSDILSDNWKNYLSNNRVDQLSHRRIVRVQHIEVMQKLLRWWQLAVEFVSDVGTLLIDQLLLKHRFHTRSWMTEAAANYTETSARKTA